MEVFPMNQLKEALTALELISNISTEKEGCYDRLLRSVHIAKATIEVLEMYNAMVEKHRWEWVCGTDRGITEFMSEHQAHEVMPESLGYRFWRHEA